MKREKMIGVLLRTIKDNGKSVVDFAALRPATAEMGAVLNALDNEGIH